MHKAHRSSDPDTEQERGIQRGVVLSGEGAPRNRKNAVLTLDKSPFLGLLPPQGRGVSCSGDLKSLSYVLQVFRGANSADKEEPLLLLSPHPPNP